MDNLSKTYKEITGFMSISVVPKYEAVHSNPSVGKYIFSYHITMENMGLVPVKLISRHWYIVDSINVQREISGEGVIGLQPVLEPGEDFSYSSWCPLHSPIGKMSGHYIFMNLHTKEKFEVTIPEFILVSDFKLN